MALFADGTSAGPRSTRPGSSPVLAVESADDILGLSASMSVADTFDDILKMTPDDIPFLTAADLCRLADVKHPTRANWAELEHVHKGAAGKSYSTTDAAELVAFKALVRALDFEEAALVWGNVRQPLRASVPIDGSKLILIDVQAGEGHLLAGLAEVGAAVRLGHPFILLDLTDEVDLAVDNCRRRQKIREPKAPPRAGPAATVHRLRKP